MPVGAIAVCVATRIIAWSVPDMQAESNRIKESECLVSGSDVHYRISDHHTKPKSLTVWIALKNRWRCSLLKIIVGEFYRFPLRIAAILRASNLKYGPTLPLSPYGHTLESFRLENTFLLACSEDIQELWDRHNWMGALEVHMAGLAFQRGARWGLNSACSKPPVAKA